MSILDDFLNDSGGGGGSGWLANWKKEGSIVIWLHSHVSPVKVYSHTFLLETEFKNKETGKKERGLSFPKFVGMDPQITYAKQYFRSRDGGGPEVVPTLDPFLILREYLRTGVEAKAISPKEVIFEWNDYKNCNMIRWQADTLSGLEKGGKLRYNHVLSAKCEYIVALVEHENPDKGVQITRVAQAIGDAMRKEIKKLIDSEGDEGDIRVAPYAFKWEYDEDASIKDMYSASRYKKAKLTDEIAELIDSDPPDLSKYAMPGPDDLTKIRAAFEAAAQIELPLDQIFSEDPAVRRAIMRGDIVKPRKVPPREKREEVEDEPTPPTRRKPAAKVEEEEPEEQTPPRRKKITHVEEEEAPPVRRRKEPEVARIPCDGPDDNTPCGYMMLPTDAKCKKCGAEYEIDDAPPPKGKPAPVEVEEEEEKPRKPATATRRAPPKEEVEEEEERPRPKTRTKPKEEVEEEEEKPKTKSKAKPKNDDDDDDEASDKCWSCSSSKRKVVDGKTVCANCGIDPGDDVPF